MARLPPQFGPYEPVQRLGAGGMAETFVAVRRGPAGFEQRVCIKRILPAYETDKDFVDAFLREARTSAQLRHANIVQVLDFGVADESHYLALELIDGVDLRALIKRRGGDVVPLDPDLVTLIAGDLAQALDHAHGGGQAREAIVHRDISPSNVLASRAGEIKLTDFGIARAIGGTHHTATGIIKGKVPYLPPEYIERGVFEPRSDLFSLGVMLYELLTGRRPFDGESDLDTVRRIVSGERLPLSSLAPSAPQALVTAVEKLLAVDMAERPASARALLELLPSVSVHRARMRLGEMVRNELGELATSEAAVQASRPSSAPPETRTHVPDQAAVADPSPPPPNHARASTSARDAHAPAAHAAPVADAQVPSLGKGPRIALAAAGLAVVALVGAVGVRAWTRGERAAPTPVAAPAPRPPAPPVPSAPKPKAEPPATAESAPATHATPPPDSDATPAAEPPQAPAEAPSAAPTQAPRTSSRHTESASERRESSDLAELRIVVIPFGDVWVDGKPRGHAPVTVRLPAGSHDIAWGDGRPAQRRTVQVTPGQRESIVLRDGNTR